MQEKDSGKGLVAMLLVMAVITVVYFYLQYDNAETQNSNTVSDQLNNVAEAEVATLPVLKAEDIRKATVFLDSNRNKNWDSGEETCDICIAKQLVVIDDSANLATVNIAGSGNVDLSGLAGNYQSWGFYKDRQVLLPQIILAEHLKNKELQIPAWETLGSVTGVNANIEGMEIMQTQPSVIRYKFNQLLPIFNKTYNEENKVWVNISNVENDIDKQIMTTATFAKDEMGEITGKAGGYYLDVTWDQSYEEQLFQDYQQLEFIIP